MKLNAAEWARVESLFPQAAELGGAERARFLDSECAHEPRVRAELEAMLEAAAGSDALFDGPVGLAASQPEKMADLLASGTRLGSWKVKSLIGHGGMGEVYLAERADGAYAMNAAIKLLKRELFSYNNAQRFLRERRVLARLSHPNIARVLDAGTTDDGRPYLVMEYVHGARVTDFAQARALGPREAARLMLAVADAVAEAHRHGVVHRDLKPANVMVDDQQQVKLLDFGIARLMDEDESATPGVLPMTPAYAAPEQILGQPLTPAADVYALGVMLFQLLTRRLPHRREGMPLPVIAAGLKDEAPERPSDAVLHGNGLFSADERARQADALTGPLDELTLRALHRSPQHRHATASDFATDLRRYLERPEVTQRSARRGARLLDFLGRRAGDRRESPPPASGDRKYWAFISYSHQDETWARWLHQSLETWRVPQRLVGRPLDDETVPRRLFPVFRDRDELPSSHELGAVINQALRQSRNLIVVCSPRSATSRWVNEEIKAFRALGRSHRVFCLIVDGEPHASDQPEIAFSECFPPALRDKGFEPIAADARARKDGKDGARLKLLAGLLGVGLDELRQRDRQRVFRERLLRTGLALAVIAALAGTTQWFLSQRAAREYQIATEQLVEAGRLELLDGRQARAAVLLHEALRRGHDTVPLRFMLGQAMLPVDALTDVRVRHGGQTVRRAIFSPDGTRFVLVAATADGVVAKVYDAATGAEVIVLKQVPAYPRIVQFLDDGRRLLVSGFAEQGATDEAGPSIAVWSLDRAEPLFTRGGYTGRAGTPVGPDGALALGTTAGLLMIDGATGAQRRVLDAGRALTALSYSTDGRWLATADQSGQVRLRSTRDDRAARVLGGFEGQNVVGLNFTPDQTRLLALSRYGDVRIWDVERGALSVAFGADPAWVSGLMFSADGRRLLTVGSEGYKVWSAGRGVLLFDIRNPLYRDAAAALSADGDHLYVADDTSSVAEVWSVRSGTRLQTLDLHTNSVSAISLDPSGERLLLASKDGGAAIWRALINPAAKLALGGLAPARVLWAGDEQLLVAGGLPGHALLATLDARTGDARTQFAGHRTYVQDASLSADGRRLLTADLEGRAGVWDATTGTVVAMLDPGLGPLFKVGLTPDGGRGVLLAAGAPAGQAGALVDARTGAVVAKLANDVRFKDFGFSRDGALLVTIDSLGRAKIWQAADGRPLVDFAAHDGESNTATFDATGASVMTSGHDHAVRIWPASGGPAISELKDPALDWVWSVVFSPDETRAAIGTTSGALWIWDRARGTARSWKGHPSAVTALKYLHGGSVLISTGYDGTIRAWDPERGVPLATLASLGGQMEAPRFTSDETRLAAASPVTRQGGVWTVAPERRSAREVGEVLRCRAPWGVADGGLTQVAVPSEGCR